MNGHSKVETQGDRKGAKSRTYQDCVLEIGVKIPKQRILKETYDR